MDRHRHDRYISASRTNFKGSRTLVALAVYEWLITLEKEFELLAYRKWSVTTWLFVVNRYLLLVTAVLTICPSTIHVSTFTIQDHADEH